MIKKSWMSQPVGPTLVSSPEGEVAGPVKLFESLPVRMRKYYSSRSVMKVLDPEFLKATRKRLMVRDGKHEQLITMLLEREVNKMVDTKPSVINGLFAVEEEKAKPRLVLEARRANHYFAEAVDLQTPHPRMFTQLKLGKEEEIYVGKLDMGHYRERLEQPKQFRPYLGLPPVKLDGKLLWPRCRVVAMRWLHSVLIAMTITEEILANDARLDPCKHITANAQAKVGCCRFVAYIDDIFVLGSDGKEVAQVYDRICSAFSRKASTKTFKRCPAY